jgi:hypothetical protein
MHPDIRRSRAERDREEAQAYAREVGVLYARAMCCIVLVVAVPFALPFIAKLTQWLWGF